MNVKSLRLYSFLPVLASVSLLAYAYYVQYVDYLDPCPLCLVQRLVILIIGILYLLTLIYPPQDTSRKIFAGIIVLVSAIGTMVSARHVWLQNLPKDEVPACGPGLSYMFDNFPIGSVLKDLFSGSGECAEISWRFLGLSMPTWTLIAFVGFIIYTLIWVKLKKS
ncbi:MAG: disulfide bond formation protein B [Proteobacteria bacterium]|nr:disulfide bond formation protein B [Pseudomonadota bacterium]